jgi:phosphatidylinositol 3-kinase
MVDANITDITNKTLDSYKNIRKLQEKFKMDLTDDEAIVYMQSIINESEKALFPQITETIHRWAQYWRS